MMTTTPLPIANALLPLLRQFCQGDYGIALGGAHAKGVADAESDLDLYLFARQVLPLAERIRLCQQFSPAVTTVTGWGTDESFVQGGTDFYFHGQKVEVWLRHVDHITGIIEECEAGVLRQELVTWTVMGFYNHCALSDLAHMLPIEDPAGILAGWQARVHQYPPRLRVAIIQRHLHAARFWPENFHYASAVQRGDLIYSMGIVQQVIHNLIQVLFALNQTYFPGDKKLGPALDHLAHTPAHLRGRIESLLLPGAATPEALSRQRTELQALLRDVEALVEQTQL